MKSLRQKVHIDRWLGLPLAWALNLAARVLGRILRRDHTIRADNVRMIAISKYVGMGSIIQATPLIRTLRTAFPAARIIFVTGVSCRPVVDRLEHIDGILTVDDRGIGALVWTTARAVVTLVRAQIDLYFDLEIYSSYASIMALTSLARNRIGFYRESAQHKLGNYTHLMYFNTRHPIRYVYLQLARAVGCEPQEPERLGQIRIGAADRDELTGKLVAAGVAHANYLVVNPNASDLMIERRWPADRFAALIDDLLSRHDIAVVLTGSSAERSYVDLLVQRISHRDRARVVNLAGTLSLGGLLALLEGSRGIVTNDTGPMHMAWALDVPSVCLFGPVDPNQYGWTQSSAKVLYSRVYCSPCVHEVDEPPCNGNNICMQRIEVDRVARAVDSMLASSFPKGTPPPERQFFIDPAFGPLGLVMRESVVAAGRHGTGCREPEPDQTLPVAAGSSDHGTPQPEAARLEETVHVR
jgi:ADP-heptose:LPS heptosyltransferase